MQHFIRWIAPFILGVVEFCFLRLATDPSRGTEWWPDLNNQVKALALSVILCYAIDYGLREMFHRYIFRKHVSVGKEYLTITLELLIITNLTLFSAYYSRLINFGQPVSDFLLVNIIYVPLDILYYTIFRNKAIFDFQQNQTIQLDKLKIDSMAAELKFLKSQYHPHFLFNALNTIYFQIDDSNEKAKNSVELLADLLRYNLYDINHKVSLKKEIGYLTSYIQFQSLRMNGKLEVTMDYDQNLDHVEVHPLLFQPLVENAFKYLGEDYHIHISLKNIRPMLVFSIENTIASLKVHDIKCPHGLGIDNLKKRLKILYPDMHKFSTTQTHNTFRAQLEIKIADYEN